MLRLLTSEDLIRIHDEVLLETGVGLAGLAGDKDLDGMIGRIENRIRYGLSSDLLYIATFYAVAIASGHCFNDGNKRTGFAAMDVFLRLNGITVTMDEDPIVQMMVDAAAGQIGHEALADRIAGHLYELFID